MRDEDKRGRDDKDNVGKELHEGCTAGQNRRRRRKERTSKPDALGSARGQSMEDVQRKRWYRSTLDRTKERKEQKASAPNPHSKTATEGCPTDGRSPRLSTYCSRTRFNDVWSRHDETAWSLDTALFAGRTPKKNISRRNVQAGQHSFLA